MTDLLTRAARDVLTERARQQSEEGWTQAHDDQHLGGEMAKAAACYAMYFDFRLGVCPPDWPWAQSWWKQKNPRRDLVRAAALILAEIERIDRKGESINPDRIPK